MGDNATADSIVGTTHLLLGMETLALSGEVCPPPDLALGSPLPHPPQILPSSKAQVMFHLLSWTPKPHIEQVGAELRSELTFLKFCWKRTHYPNP